MTRTIDYTDALGFPRRVFMPTDDIPVEEGIPASFDVDDLYEHMPVEFRRALAVELWALGLIEPCHLLQPGAAEKFMAALRSVCKHDAFNAIAIARERCT